VCVCICVDHGGREGREGIRREREGHKWGMLQIGRGRRWNGESESWEKKGRVLVIFVKMKLFELCLCSYTYQDILRKGTPQLQSSFLSVERAWLWMLRPALFN